MKKLMGFVLLLVAFSSFASEERFFVLTDFTGGEWEEPNITFSLREGRRYNNGELVDFAIGVTCVILYHEIKYSSYDYSLGPYVFPSLHMDTFGHGGGKGSVIKVTHFNEKNGIFGNLYTIQFALNKIAIECNTENMGSLFYNLGIKAREIKSIKNFNLYLEVEEMLYHDYSDSAFVPYAWAYLNAKKDHATMNRELSKEEFNKLSNNEKKMVEKIQRDI